MNDIIFNNFHSLVLFARIAELRNNILSTELLFKDDRLADTTWPAREKFLSLADEVDITAKTFRAMAASAGKLLSLPCQKPSTSLSSDGATFCI